MRQILAGLFLFSFGIFLYPSNKVFSLQDRMGALQRYERALHLEAPGEPIQPVPQNVGLDRRKVALGESLFHDPRLSHDNSISCASCHMLENGGANNLPRSIGINGARTAVNSPTVFNSGFNFVQFWDGRAESLEDQIDGPIHHPNEMGTNWQVITIKLRSDTETASLFEEIYADGVTAANVKDAIAEFERSLITPDARFDQFLRGDAEALNWVERKGYRLFKSRGCSSCHQGVNVGGNLYQRLGIFQDYFADRGGVMDADLGRFNVTGEPEDKHVFRVPSLRNVELTAPYFHDGTQETLEGSRQRHGAVSAWCLPEWR